jgi:gliding motility-associated protein GldM
VPGNTLGHQSVKGWIRLREATGDYKYFKYESEYVVAPSAVAISAEKMNVVYAGVDNPLAISAAGVAPGDLEVKAEGAGAKLTNLGNGAYNIKVAPGGTVTITVYERTAEGLKKQGQPKVFRVKKLPDPPLKLLGKPIGANTELTQTEARNITQFSLDLSNYDFAAPFKVQSFSITMGGNGNSWQFFNCEGAVLSPAALYAIRRVKRGSKIYFEDIVVKAPDGNRQLSNVKISVK